MEIQKAKTGGDGKLDTKWRSWNAAVHTIATMGWEHYASQFPENRNAFVNGDRIVRCIDGRTPEGGIHLGGAGALLGLEQTALFLKKAGAKGITSHEDCGAVKKMMADRGIAGDPEKIARNFAEKVALEAGILYKGHIGVSGPHEEHCVYYVGAKGFDRSKAPKLPHGFTVSRKYLDPGYALAEVEVAISIALGSHGFGERFTAEDPFVLIPIGESQSQTAMLTKELAPLATKYGGRVVIAPK